MLRNAPVKSRSRTCIYRRCGPAKKQFVPCRTHEHLYTHVYTGIFACILYTCIDARFLIEFCKALSAPSQPICERRPLLYIFLEAWLAMFPVHAL